MEITKMKGGRIAKYRYRESMNEKAPEVAERSSKRKCLRMGRSSKKVARRPGSEKMWTSSGGSRTCNHKGSNFCTVAAALVQTVVRSGRVPAAVVGSVDHHDMSAHRHPKAPFGGPGVGVEGIDHHERTIQNIFESVQKEVGGRLAPLLIRLLLCLSLLVLPRALALLVQLASRIDTNTILILPRVARGDRIDQRKG
jgi:hypothetical protein